MTVTALDTRQPDTALALHPGQQTWTKQQEAGLAQIGLADASDGDRLVFLHQCQRTGLDPFARQIYMIPRREKVPGTQNQYRTKWTIQTGIDGFRVNRARAERKAGARGILSRPVFYDHDGNPSPVWVRRDPPAACEITYTVRDANGDTPYTSVLLFREYCQTDSSGNLTGQWAVKGAHMLEKCTEADVYRKAFPQDFSGIHLDDAMAPPEPAPESGTGNGRNRGRVTAGEILERRAAAAGDDTQAGPGPAPAGREDPQERTPGDPRAAGTACSICGATPVRARGWCATHYTRWQRYGDPNAVIQIQGDDKARFWSYVNTDGPTPEHRPELGPCWLWTGGTNRDGYGTFELAGHKVGAHQFSFDLAGGDMAGLPMLDHLCRVPACVRPEHLEPVTNAENQRRGKNGVLRGAQPPPPPPEDEPGSVSKDQLTKLHTVFSGFGFTGDDRERKLAIAETITGRAPLHGPAPGRSSKNLSLTEASKLIDTLDGFGGDYEKLADWMAGREQGGGDDG